MPKVKPAPTPRMTVEEWNAEGIRRFGLNQFLWKFVCPMCGNVQSAHDFRAYKDRGATPNSANQVCIGRYEQGPVYKAFGENRKTTPKPVRLCPLWLAPNTRRDRGASRRPRATGVRVRGCPSD